MSFQNEKEDGSLNQYWFSDSTIKTFVDEIALHGKRCAFLSSPSLFFALPEETRRNSRVFEFDKRWEADPGFVFYDFNDPEVVAKELCGAFDYVVVDPPFITREVWSKYMKTVKLIREAKDTKVLFTSVLENHAVLEELFGDQLRVCGFRPSIPHLTYQYHTFTSYEAVSLDKPNPELPPEDPKIVAARNMANDMRESEVAFRAQMQNRNRENEEKLPAPKEAPKDCMLWNHVPEGLTEYAGGAAAPPEEKEVDYGPEYAALMARRTDMERFKKLLEAAMHSLDALWRLRATSDGDTEKEAVATTATELAKTVDQLQNIRETLASVESESTVYGIMGDAIASLAGAEGMTKDKYQNLCADVTRKFKSRIFNRQKELLQEIKKIKAGKK